MNRLLPILALVALPAVAQLSESVEVHIVEVEAVVLDREGKAVAGLTRDDFEVEIDGRPAAITNFFAVQRSAVVDERRSAFDAPAGVKIVAPKIPSRLIIVFDDLHLRQASRKRAIDALRAYVETAMTESTTAMLLRWNGTMTVRVKPTNSREALLRELDALATEPAVAQRNESERKRLMRAVDNIIVQGPQPSLTMAEMAQLVFREIDTYANALRREVEQTLAALSDLIAMATGLEGRKVVLYVSEGLPTQPGADLRDYAIEVFSKHPLDDVGSARVEDISGGRSIDSTSFDTTRAFRALADRAQRSAVIFSALDPAGVRGFEGTTAEHETSLASLDTLLVRSNESQGLRMVAAESGGRYIENENNLDRAVAVLTDDVSTYYSLGVQPPAKKALDVKVRVRGRDDLRVLASRRRTVQSRDEAVASSIRARLYSREQVNPLRARVFLGAAWPAGSRCVAPVQIVVPQDKLTFLDGKGELSFHAVALDEKQQESNVRTLNRPIRQTAGTAVAETITFGFQPRRYLISVAIVDRTSGETSYLLTDVDAKVCGR